ncbi:MAG: restriction endonuclease [Bdellovibrio sp.]|nr:restriction endonuclease [Bdellovibrio sp.]
MFLFFHKEQTDANSRCFKGVLFETLLKTLFEKLGYQVDVRRKKNSLEYDIEGKNQITHEVLVAEAKAHENTIPGKDVAAFVGKLFPLGIHEKKVHGLFMSTSSFSPEAEDYFISLGNINIKQYCGNKLFLLINEKLTLPKTETLEKSIPKGYIKAIDYLLVTDSGIFKVLICRSEQSGTPNSFIIFNEKGIAVTDAAFLKNIREHVAELQELEEISANLKTSQVGGRVIELGLQLSTDWTDYKLPASPKYFVGRAETIKQIEFEIANSNTSLLQIKSRSGVGKSSLLALLADRYGKKRNKVELHDSRDIKASLDIFILIQRFTGASDIAKDFREVNEQIRIFSNSLTNKALFFVDQFESTFSRKEIFDAYESLFSLLSNYPQKIVTIIARKNDQLTTYDETEISLDKINANSKSFTLKDFDKAETVLLVKKIIDAWGSSIDQEVLSYIIEFSQGFPWLIKRTMAHILNQLNAGISQSDLIATGLKLDDLFNEELAGLDEVQLDYLSRIIQNLPANYHQLHKVFDEDPLLKQMLDHLTKTRLIRLSGSTYDTYNDVLKEFVLFRKLPQFKQKTLYRLSAYTVIRNFLSIYTHAKFDADLVQKETNTSKGTAFNIVREWKTLNLVETTDAGWKIPQIVLDVIKQGRLGDHLRRELAKNEAVSCILNLLSQGKSISLDSVPEILVMEFPFVEASRETWQAYSKALLSWMQALIFISIDKHTGIISIPDLTRDEIVSTLGNLTNIKARGRRGNRGIFIPNYRFSLSFNFVSIYSLLGEFNSDNFDSNDKKAYSDLKNGGWAEGNELLVADESEFIEDAAGLFEETLGDFWKVVASGGDLMSEIKRILPSLSTEISAAYVIKVLLSWGKGLGIIEDKRYVYSSNSKIGRPRKKTTKVIKKKSKSKRKLVKL